MLAWSDVAQIWSWNQRTKELCAAHLFANAYVTSINSYHFGESNFRLAECETWRFTAGLSVLCAPKLRRPCRDQATNRAVLGSDDANNVGGTFYSCSKAILSEMCVYFSVNEATRDSQRRSPKTFHGDSEMPPHGHADVLIRTAQWLNERGFSPRNFTKGKNAREKQSGAAIDSWAGRSA